MSPVDTLTTTAPSAFYSEPLYPACANFFSGSSHSLNQHQLGVLIVACDYWERGLTLGDSVRGTLSSQAAKARIAPDFDLAAHDFSETYEFTNESAHNLAKRVSVIFSEPLLDIDLPPEK